MNKLKHFLESNYFTGLVTGVMVGMLYVMVIRALYYWTWSATYPLGY